MESLNAKRSAADAPQAPGPRRSEMGVCYPERHPPRGGEQNETPARTEVEVGEGVPEWARRDSNARPLAPEPPEASYGQRPLA